MCHKVKLSPSESETQTSGTNRFRIQPRLFIFDAPQDFVTAVVNLTAEIISRTQYLKNKKHRYEAKSCSVVSEI